MTREEAIKWLKQINAKYINGGDESFDESRHEAIDMAISALKENKSADSLLTDSAEADKESECKLDLISRADIAEQFDETYCKPCRAKKNDYNGVKCRACWVDDALDVVDDVRSRCEVDAKLDSDLIKRADALSYPLSFDHYDKENGSREFICGVESYREYIQHLPSVSAVSIEKAEEITKRIYNETLAKVSKECKECKERLRSVSAERVACYTCEHWNSETKGCKRNPSVEEWTETDYCSYHSTNGVTSSTLEVPKKHPSAERVGEWIGEADGYADGELVYDMWYCSNCDYQIDDDREPTFNYCPNCGARMCKGGDTE